MDKEELTKREYFTIEIAKAMLGKGNENVYTTAAKAVLFADALLEKLNEEQKNGDSI